MKGLSDEVMTSISRWEERPTREETHVFEEYRTKPKRGISIGLNILDRNN